MPAPVLSAPLVLLEKLVLKMNLFKQRIMLFHSNCKTRDQLLKPVVLLPCSLSSCDCFASVWMWICYMCFAEYDECVKERMLPVQ